MAAENDKLKRHIIMKHVLCFVLILIMVGFTANAFTVEAKTKLKKGSGYAGLVYQDWCQKMSKSSQMQSDGCRITAYTKLLHEAGYTALANPDKFYEWGTKATFKSNGKKKTFYTKKSVNERSSFGKPLIAAVKEQGGTASLVKKISISKMSKAKVSKTIMSYIKSGYYCILSCEAHTSYVGRKESLAAGEAVLLDSSYSSSPKWRGTYGNIINYKKYTANKFTNLRVYKVSSPVKKNTVIKVTLDPQNGGSKQYIYQKTNSGIYSNNACTTKVSTITVPKKSSYIFGGYYTGTNGNGTQYINASGKILLNSNSLTNETTLYAYWKKQIVAEKPTISVTSAPSVLIQGNSFGLRGTITANVNITRVDASIIDASGKAVQTKYDTPNKNSFNIKNGKINQELKFGSLSAGNYILKIVANTSAGSTIYLSSFTVVGKPNISVTSAPSSIKKGSSFGLRGTITANAKITRVDVYIINSSGKTVQTKYDTPNKNSFNIKNGKINQQLYFGKLSKGTYTLKITAKNTAGTATYTKKFTVK